VGGSPGEMPRGRFYLGLRIFPTHNGATRCETESFAVEIQKFLPAEEHTMNVRTVEAVGSAIAENPAVGEFIGKYMPDAAKAIAQAAGLKMAGETLAVGDHIANVARLGEGLTSTTLSQAGQSAKLFESIKAGRSDTAMIFPDGKTAAVLNPDSVHLHTPGTDFHVNDTSVRAEVPGKGTIDLRVEDGKVVPYKNGEKIPQFAGNERPFFPEGEHRVRESLEVFPGLNLTRSTFIRRPDNPRFWLSANGTEISHDGELAHVFVNNNLVPKGKGFISPVLEAAVTSKTAGGYINALNHDGDTLMKFGHTVNPDSVLSLRTKGPTPIGPDTVDPDELQVLGQFAPVKGMV
jgi:hypothetical protein